MVFRHRNFALFFFGLIISNSGTWMAQTARSWLVHEITGSGAALGLVFGAFGIPMVLFPYFGGVIGDRFDRRKVLWVTQIIAALNALVLGFLIATDVLEIWHIVVVSFAQGTVLAFDQPPRQALLPDLVPRDELRSAIAMNSSVFTGAAFIGPAIFGLLVGQWGVPLAAIFFINAASFGSVMIALSIMRLPKHDSPRMSSDVHESMGEGLRFAIGSELVMTVMVLTVVSSMFGSSYQTLLPIFADVIFNSGEQGLGVMTSAGGAGAIVGSALLGFGARLPRNGILIPISSLVFAALMVGFAASPDFILSIALLFALGFTSTLVMAGCRTVMQLETPRHLMGRVMSLYAIAVIGFGPMGGFIAGPLADLTGAQNAIYIASAVVGVTTVFILKIKPVLRSAD